ncbi:MAG TPA: hypothetical protein VHX20_05805 [Terracidiphilus sp.]|jgi:hypothetical protein|nr:hypothetical protein [Terracidiphilus sp.]
MRAIHSIKRDLTLALCISALVFVCALAWGHPFFGPANNLATGPAAAAPISAHQISAHPISRQ